jgi:hypothetical protein
MVQVIGRLIHALFLEGGTSSIFFQNPAPGHIVSAVNRTGCVAVQVAAIASKGDQVTECANRFSAPLIATLLRVLKTEIA